MAVEIIKNKIPKQELKKIAQKDYGYLIKIAVDVKKEIMAVGGEFHSQCQEALINQGCLPKNIWGANIVFGKPQGEKIMYDSLINIKPNFKHYEMEITNKKIQNKIKKVVEKLIE